MNPARVAALRLGMGEKMVAFTVQINCGSGMQSIDTAYRYIREGVSDLILAGGAEALSHAPLVWPQQGVRWFAGLAGAKGIGEGGAIAPPAAIANAVNDALAEVPISEAWPLACGPVSTTSVTLPSRSPASTCTAARWPTSPRA